MVFTTYGKNLIRDNLSSTVVAMAFGSSGSPNYTEATYISLGSEFLRLNIDSKDITKSTTVVFDTVVPTTDGIGSIFAEVGLFNTGTGSAGSVITRSVYPETEKTDIHEINYLYTIKIV